MTPFKNLTYYDYSNPDIIAQQKAEIDKVKAQFGKEYHNIINGEKITTDDKIKSYAPGDKDTLIGTFQKSGIDDAEKAMQAALNTFESWRYTSPEERANLLFKCAEIAKRRRMEINAWMISEAGKNFLEADADTCEAIDFLEFYAREALRYGDYQPLTNYEPEKNEYFYVPLGVGIVIPPWNFPFAILVGMTMAAVAAGNTVILKPASDTPKMGQLLMEMLEEAGAPDGLVNFVCGSGPVIGDYLVEHPKSRFISFTGSKAVGTSIYEKAAKVRDGQIWLKRVVAEMGGKDAIIVDRTFKDLDYAASEIVKSAFGFQGQKCSAGSRVIIDEPIYDELVEKIVAKTKEIEVGNPWDDAPAGPVINEKAYNDILGYIEKGKEQGNLLVGGNKADGNGWYIEPTVIEASEQDVIAREEIFGPVLAVLKAKDYDDAQRIFNDSEYGLTGALFAGTEELLSRGKRELHCGNLYLNRKCTGALVDVHPFGGFNMSGTDSKAGSRDYLMLFMQGKSVARALGR